MLMCDFKAASHSGANLEGNTLGLWVNAVGGNLGTVYLGTDTGGNTPGSGAFDLLRHHGSMNILYVDGHVDTQPILSNGATKSSGGASLTNPLNCPSGGLIGVSMDIDFR